MKNKLMKTIVIASAILNLLPVNVLAGNDWRKSDWSIVNVEQHLMDNSYEYGNFIRIGGVNTIDGVKAENRSECEMLESHLKQNGYILVNTKDRQIDDEEFELMKKIFQKISLNNNMLEDEKLFYSENQKMYLNKDVYDICLEQVKEKGVNRVHPTTILELATSCVYVDYLVWNSVDNIGKIYTYEFINDNLKKYDEINGTELDKNAGYIYIYTDIDSRILFSEQYSKTFQQIDIIANVPTLVKMRNGFYKIDTINDVSVETDESLLGNYNNNIFKLNNSFTADNPVIIDLTEGVNDKYDLKPYNIKGNVDFRSNEWIDIDPDEYEVIVEENEKTKENVLKSEQTFTTTSKIILGISIFILFIIGCKKVIDYKKKESKEND